MNEKCPLCGLYELCSCSRRSYMHAIYLLRERVTALEERWVIKRSLTGGTGLACSDDYEE